MKGHNTQHTLLRSAMAIRQSWVELLISLGKLQLQERRDKRETKFIYNNDYGKTVSAPWTAKNTECYLPVLVRIKFLP